MHKLILTSSAILLLLIKHSSAQCADNPVMNDYRTCYGDTFSSYYLRAYGYQSAAETTTSGHSTMCYSYQSCWYSTMTFGSGFRCFGYESCRASTMSAVYATCSGDLSCYGATITQTANSHAVQCFGRQSCADAAIYGANGIYVDFTGYLAASNARLYVPAGATAYISCGYSVVGNNVYWGEERLPRYTFPDCGSATIYVEDGGTVDCKSIPYVSDYSDNPTIESEPCPTQQSWNGADWSGMTFAEWMVENEKKHKDIQPVDIPSFDAPPDDDMPPFEDPNGFNINLKDPLYIISFIAIVSILLNCCQSYKIFGKFGSKSRKKVYQGVAQTDNSDVELM